MKKKFTMLLMLVLCAFASSVMAQTTYYRPGARTTTLEVGKQYFISAATFYNNARPNLLYNNNGTLAYSDNKKPNALINDASYLFTVVKIGANNIYYITNSDGKYLQANTMASDDEEKGVTIVPYSKAKGSIACGSDVQACGESGNKIEYNNITDDTPIVCVYHNNSTGWRHISGLEIGKSTPFAFYEVEKVFPEITTDESNPKWYTIKNVRGNAYAYYNGTGTAMGMSGTVDKAAYLFYFTAGKTEGTYKIHNYVNSKLCAAPNSWTDEGIDWHIQISGSTVHPGLAISKEATLTAEGDEAWNDYQNNHNSVNWYGGNDDGSTWQIERYEFESILPTVQLSTNDNIVLHYIRSQRRTNFVNFDGHNVTFKEGNVGLSSYWYFVQDEEAQKNAPAGFVACRIYNAAHATGVENHSSGYMGDDSWPARVYYIGTGEHERNGYLIRRSDDANNGWHDYSGTHVGDYGLNDAGSYWRIYPSETTSADLMQQAAEAKTNALNMISGMYEYADYYTYTDEAIATAKNAINAVNIGNITGAVQSLINSSFESILTSLKETQKGAAPAAGDYIQLKNREHKKYLKAFETYAEGADDMSDHATVWYVEAGEGSNFRLRNLATKKYVGHIRKSATTAMQEDVANAAQFSWSNQEDIYAVFKDLDITDVAESDVNHVYGHVNGGKLVGWVADASSSQWAVAKISAEPYLQALREEIARATAFVGTAVGQKTVADAAAFENLKSEAQALVDNTSTDIIVLHHTKLELAAMVDAGTVNLPVAGKYYQIKSANPDFYKKQGKEMGIYSSDGEGRLAWKALDSTDKAFYWTITPKDGKFILKNEADGKYVPAVADDKYMMTATETDAATFTLTWLTVNQFNIAGNGTMHMMGHTEGAGTGDRICSWSGGINSSSAWTIVEVEHPDFAAAKVSLELAVAKAMELIESNSDAPGFYSSDEEGLADRIEEINEFKATITADTPIATIQTQVALANEIIASFKINLPKAGKFYRIGYNFGDAGVKYLQDEKAGVKDNAIVMTSDKGVSSIYYVEQYGEELRLKSCTTEYYIKEDGNTRGLQNSVTNGGEITFSPSPILGQIKIQAPSYFHASVTDKGVYFLEHCGNTGNPEHTTHYFLMEEVDIASVINELNEQFDELVLTAQAYGNAMDLGRYTSTLYNDTKVLGAVIENLRKVDANTTIAEYKTKIEELERIIASFNSVKPGAGFYYFVNYENDAIWGEYLSDDRKSDSNPERILSDADNISEKNIFYYDGESLIGYASGFGFESAVCNTKNPAGRNHFSFIDAYEIGRFCVKSTAGTSAEGWSDGYWKNNGGVLERVENISDASSWNVLSVVSLPVTIGDFLHATFYAPVAVKVPAGVKAYTGEAKNEDWFTLTEVAGTIPAGTAVVLIAEKADTYYFEIVASKEEAIASPHLKGTVSTKVNDKKNDGVKYYTLQAHDFNGDGTKDGIAFKKYTGDNLNGFRAYIELPEGTEATALRIRFADEEGATSIESVETDEELVIFDLAGRRVQKMEKGIYIVNGKKVVVK